jgi:hypothetical protein
VSLRLAPERMGRAVGVGGRRQVAPGASGGTLPGRAQKGRLFFLFAIQAMSRASHPHLLKIYEADPDVKWFVSQYHPRGTLAAHRDRFAGDFVQALKAFRPLVEGVATLHDRNIVHRDSTSS